MATLALIYVLASEDAYIEDSGNEAKSVKRYVQMAAGEIDLAGGGGSGSPNLGTPAARTGGSDGSGEGNESPNPGTPAAHVGGSDGAGEGNGSPNPGTPAVRLGGSDGGGEGNGSSLREKILHHLHERVEKKEEQILKIEATVFQVANYNLVFQGVILAALTNGGSSSSSAFRCDLSFLPMCLSAVGSILNFAILWMNAAKYSGALEELDKMRLVLHKHQKYPTTSIDDMEKRHLRSKGRRMLILVLLVILFGVFATLNLLAARMIPCR